MRLTIVLIHRTAGRLEMRTAHVERIRSEVKLIPNARSGAGADREEPCTNSN